MSVTGAKLIGAGLATIGLSGSGIGAGFIKEKFSVNNSIILDFLFGFGFLLSIFMLVYVSTPLLIFFLKKNAISFLFILFSYVELFLFIQIIIFFLLFCNNKKLLQPNIINNLSLIKLVFIIHYIYISHVGYMLVKSKTLCVLLTLMLFSTMFITLNGNIYIFIYVGVIWIYYLTVLITVIMAGILSKLPFIRKVINENLGEYYIGNIGINMINVQIKRAIAIGASSGALVLSGDIAMHVANTADVAVTIIEHKLFNLGEVPDEVIREKLVREFVGRTWAREALIEKLGTPNDPKE